MKNMMRQGLRIYGILCMTFCFGSLQGWAEDRKSESPLHISSLDECIELALTHHVSHHISQTAIQIAEAQHQQALSAYWPQAQGSVLLARRDEELDFLFPEETALYNIKGLAPVPLDVEVTVPEKQVKLADRDMLYGALDMSYPLYTGGKRKAVIEQSGYGIRIAQEQARRTELQLMFDVTRMYWGAMLAGKLQELSQQTVERFKATMTLTEQFYQSGSGHVQKTDYLRMQAISAGLEAMQEQLKSNETLAKTALVNAMGLAWTVELQLDDTELPSPSSEARLPLLVADAYRFNPDWAQLELALQIAESHIREAGSNYLPKVALQGRLDAMVSDYDAGLMTEANRESWMLGLGMKIPLFAGFRTKAQVREARLKLEKLQQQQFLLREGLALQVQHAFLQIERSRGQIEALTRSVTAAEEYRQLTIRAYQHELAETQEVVEAQVLEAFLQGQYLKALFDYTVNTAQLDFLIGRELHAHFQ